MRVLGWMVAGGMVAAAAEMAAQLHACPVGFRAEIDPRLTLREVRNGKQAADSTLVQLHFDSIEPKKVIVAASVTAHGFAPTSLFMQVQQTPEENRTQAFELKGAGSAGGLMRTEVEVTAVPFVRWVELNQITFADGTVWHPAAGLACKAELSRFHYVSAR
jgi:hypothetical protein